LFQEIAMRVSAQPRLYDPEPDSPVLNGTRCARCQTVYCPPLGLGCEVCGATGDALKPAAIAAVGTVHSLAEVHVHPGKPQVPFIIAEVQLDAGPLIRAMLTGDCGPIGIGDTVSALWTVTDTTDRGDDIVEPAFGPAEPNLAPPAPNSSGAAE
jgi:uncharacterized OB-fold protein